MSTWRPTDVVINYTHNSQLRLLVRRFSVNRPARRIGDRPNDSDPPDWRLERDYGIELIAPNRENRSQTQDGASPYDTSDVGVSSGSLPGCSGSGDCSRVSNITMTAHLDRKSQDLPPTSDRVGQVPDTAAHDARKNERKTTSRLRGDVWRGKVFRAGQSTGYPYFGLVTARLAWAQVGCGGERNWSV